MSITLSDTQTIGKPLAREEIRWIAQEAEGTAVQAREMALRVESLWRNRAECALPIADMDERFMWVEDTAYISTEDEGVPGTWICLATGGTPVDEEIKQELLRYETLREFIRDAYSRLRYSDEVSYVDKRSLWVTQINRSLASMNFLGDDPVFGLDVPEACSSGVTAFDY